MEISTITSYDAALLQWLQANRLISADFFFQFISSATSYVSALVLLSYLGLALVRRTVSARRVFIALIATFFLSVILGQILKLSFDRPRPFEYSQQIHKLSDGGSRSFPSGHTVEAFTVAFSSLLILTNRQLAVLLFIWASTVAYSRMVLGVHYATDILAGIIVALFCVVFARYWARRRGYI